MEYWKKNLILSGLAMAVGLGLQCAGSLAQDATQAADDPFNGGLVAATVAKVEKQSLASTIQQYKVDIELAKPTPIQEFMDSIQNQAPTPLNILVSRSTVSLMVPPMQLRQISIQSALNAMIAATEGEGNWNLDDDEEMIVVDRDLGFVDVSVNRVSVINAADILENTEEASLLSAIEIGLNLRDSSKKNVTIKLHKETKLLFVKGVQEDINIVMQIVSQLGGGPWPPVSGGGGFGGESGGLGGGGAQGGGAGGGGVF